MPCATHRAKNAMIASSLVVIFELGGRNTLASNKALSLRVTKSSAFCPASAKPGSSDGNDKGSAVDLIVQIHPADIGPPHDIKREYRANSNTKCHAPSVELPTQLSGVTLIAFSDFIASSQTRPDWNASA